MVVAFGGLVSGGGFVWWFLWYLVRVGAFDLFAGGFWVPVLREVVEIFNMEEAGSLLCCYTTMLLLKAG